MSRFASLSEPMRGLRAWRRRRAARRVGFDPARWRRLRNEVWLVATLSDAEAAALCELTIAFLDRFTVEGAAGFDVSDEVRWAVAAQACVPVLGLGLDSYAGWREIVVYPGAFLARHDYVDEHGIAHEEARPLSGEAGAQGPVVVSWADVERDLTGDCEGNVVVHECAHKLDLLDGAANGMPPLHAGMNVDRWAATLSDAFGNLAAFSDDPERAPMDLYGTQDPGEFFAVASEAFFTHPLALKNWDSALYDELSAFYRQSPAARFQASQ